MFFSVITAYYEDGELKGYGGKVNKDYNNFISHLPDMDDMRFTIEKIREALDQGADYDIVRNIVKQHMRIKQLPKMRAFKQKKLTENPYFKYISQFNVLDNMHDLSEEDINFYKNKI